MIKLCKQCKKKFETTEYIVSVGGGKYCSKKCTIIASKNGKIKQCLICKKTFYVSISQQHIKYCSHKCKGLSMRGKNNPWWSGGKQSRTCEICGKIFRRHESQIEKGGGRFCSPKCVGLWKRKAHKGCCLWLVKIVFYRHCKQCGKKFKTKIAELSRGRGKFCSKECHSLWNRGTNNSNWTGGYSEGCQQHRTEREWDKIRKSIYCRDEYSCRLCDYKAGGYLTLAAHHLIPWRISQNDNPENLITLCSACHRKVENRLRGLRV